MSVGPDVPPVEDDLLPYHDLNKAVKDLEEGSMPGDLGPSV